MKTLIEMCILMTCLPAYYPGEKINPTNSGLIMCSSILYSISTDSTKFWWGKTLANQARKTRANLQ